MIKEFLALNSDMQALKNAFGSMVKVGSVAEVDPARGYRLQLGVAGEKPFLSPWYPHPEGSKTSVPLKMGQIVGVINPGGDPRQGVIVRGGYSDELPSPNSDMDANVFEDGGVRVEVKDGALTITVGSFCLRASAKGLEMTGGRIVHDNRSIGSDHHHGGVERGGNHTDVPDGA